MLKVTVDKWWISHMTSQLSSEKVTVHQYPYRSARVSHPLFVIERNDNLEKLLAEKSGKRLDNHTLYKVSFEDGNSFAIECSDFTMGIGVGITEKHW